MLALENLHSLFEQIFSYSKFSEKQGHLFHISVKFYMHEISAARATNF